MSDNSFHAQIDPSANWDPNRKVALITGNSFFACASVKLNWLLGITGQDGSYLTEFLLGKGYVVHGIIRRSSSFNTSRIEHLYADQHQSMFHSMKR